MYIHGLLYSIEYSSRSDASSWEVKCFASCQSLNVLCFLTCNFCKEVTYIGKTNNFQLRTNNHISSCRHGKSTDQFDNHVFELYYIHILHFQIFIPVLYNGNFKRLRGVSWFRSHTELRFIAQFKFSCVRSVCYTQQ